VASSSSSPLASGVPKPARLSGIESDIIDVFVDLAALLSLPRSYGEIYGLLFASPQPLSFADIQAKLGWSKGSVSQGLRALRNVGAIRRVDGVDPRREHFVAETELRQLMGGLLKGSIQPHLKSGAARLDGIRVRHRAELSARTEESRLLGNRLDKLQRWHRRGGTLLPIITRFLG
jgi:DNA-binding transcriptional regulator GbsR (MarR family)